MMKNPLDIHLSVYHNERELLEALWRDEHTACTCLFKQFSPHLSALAYRLMRDRDEADDVVQESFIQACRHIKAFEGKSSLLTWLHSITFHAAQMQRRRRELPTVQINADIDDEQSPLCNVLVDETKTPDHAVLATEWHETIKEALNALPASLRSALVLRAIEGLTTKEAAEQLGIEEAAVKVRLHRARQQLRQMISSLDAETPGPM